MFVFTKIINQKFLCTFDWFNSLFYKCSRFVLENSLPTMPVPPGSKFFRQGNCFCLDFPSFWWDIFQKSWSNVIKKISSIWKEVLWKKNLPYFTTYILLSKRQLANFQDLNFRFGLWSKIAIQIAKFYFYLTV